MIGLASLLAARAENASDPRIFSSLRGEEPTMQKILDTRPWNKGKLIGQKPPLQPKHVWAIRTRLQLAEAKRDLALFNLAIDSKLRGCDLVRLKVEDVAPHG